MSSNGTLTSMALIPIQLHSMYSLFFFFVCFYRAIEVMVITALDLIWFDHLQVQIPCNAPVGIWKLEIVTANLSALDNIRVHHCTEDIYILFNPWGYRKPWNDCFCTIKKNISKKETEYLRIFDGGMVDLFANVYYFSPLLLLLLLVCLVFIFQR